MANKELEGKARDALDHGQLDKAENFFAQALRLVTETGVSDHRDQIRPLVGLGDVYQQRLDAESIVKAAALFNAALVRCYDELERVEIRGKISEKGIEFVRKVCQNVFTNPHEPDIERERHISSLTSIRNECKAALSALSPIESDNPSDYVQRANDVHTLHVKIAAEIRAMVKRMIEECMVVIGPPPCKHAIIGLGSLAREETTPYSDLEFAILVEEGCDSEPNVAYFRLLTHYIHVKVVNLGETILPAVGIRSLNDFYSGNPEDDWFFDEVTPQGFAFDGAMPWASKVPTGRHKTEGKDALELIRTPKNMAALQAEETSVKEGYHVADVLSSVVLIEGQEELVQEYRREMMTILTAPTKLHVSVQEENREVSDSLHRIYNLNDDPDMFTKMHDTSITRPLRTVMEQRAVNALAADIETYDDRLSNLDESGKLLHVKKEIYRLPSTLLEGLARFYGIMSCSSWERIEELQKKGVLNAKAAQNLKVAVAISMELRLKCYLKYGSQRGLMNATVPLQIKEEECTEALFHVQDPGILVAFYSVLLSLREAIEEALCDPFKEFANTLSKMLSGNLVDNGPKTKGLVYSKLLQNRISLEYFRQADKEKPGDTAVLDAMGNFLHLMGQFQDALKTHQASLDVKQHTGYLNLPENIAMSHMMIGRDLLALGRADEAVEHQRKALELLNVQTLEDRPSKFAATYINLGLALEDSGKYIEADEYYQKVIETFRMSRGNPLLAKAINNRGNVANKLGKGKEALAFYKKALDLQFSLFGRDTAHPDIATGYNNIGTIYLTMGEDDMALEAFQRSLYIKRRVHGTENDHTSIAASMVNIAALFQQMGRHRESLVMSESAEAMLERLGQTQSVHMATAMGVTGISLAQSERYKKDAIQKLLGATAIMESKDIESRGLAKIHYELGSLYRSTGSKMKCLECLQRSVHLFEKFTDTRGKDSSLAYSLALLASAFYEYAEYPAALLNFKKALHLVPEEQIMRKVKYSRNLGQVLLKAAQVQEAVDTIITSMELLESVPDEDRGNVQVEDFEAALGAALAAAGQFSLANVYYAKAHAKYSLYGEDSCSDLSAVEGGMCISVYLECASLVRQGKVVEAREILEESEEDPGDPDLYRKLANTTYNQEGLAETTQFLETVVYLDPKDSRSRRNLARMYHVQARLSEACGNVKLSSKMIMQANDEYVLMMCGKRDLSLMTEYGNFLCLSRRWEEAMLVLLQVVAEDCQVGFSTDITCGRLDIAAIPEELKSEVKNQKEGKLHVPCRHLSYFLLARAFLESENQRGADEIVQVFGREVQDNVNSSIISWSLLGYALWRVRRHLEASAAFATASNRMEETSDFDLTVNNWAACVICAVLSKLEI